MQQFVKWDHEDNKILIGPQGLRGEGDNWYEYADSGDIINPHTQTRRLVYSEDTQTVTGIVDGDPSLTWLQSRQANYAGLEDQLDMIWHDIDNGTLDATGSFYASIKAVKDGSPKPD
jgi:hypothetical protein|tara:strand:+ start:925 stop:1275 length:351 start_codon:yes stop_codon:yes gene_type:complete